MNGDGVSSDPIWASWMRLTCFFYYKEKIFLEKLLKKHIKVLNKEGTFLLWFK